jgi:hypothetical protein
MKDIHETLYLEVIPREPTNKVTNFDETLYEQHATKGEFHLCIILFHDSSNVKMAAVGRRN